MTDDGYVDIGSVDGQAALIAETRRAIEAIGSVAATSPDDLVRVWVTVSGSVVDIDLDEATRRLDPDDLARLITATAQRAAQLAAMKVAEVMGELDRRRAQVLRQISEVDPDIAAALRDVAEKTRPATAPAGDPFSFLPQIHDSSANDDDW
jgi:DNA-binding protein YbaB